MICADCTADAVYLFDDPGAVAVPYCNDHLPLFLRKRAELGHFRIAEPEAIVSNTKKSTKPVTEPEPVVEETPSES